MNKLFYKRKIICGILILMLVFNFSTVTYATNITPIETNNIKSNYVNEEINIKVTSFKADGTKEKYNLKTPRDTIIEIKSIMKKNDFNKKSLINCFKKIDIFKDSNFFNSDNIISELINTLNKQEALNESELKFSVGFAVVGYVVTFGNILLGFQDLEINNFFRDFFEKIYGLRNFCWSFKLISFGIIGAGLMSIPTAIEYFSTNTTEERRDEILNNETEYHASILSIHDGFLGYIYDIDGVGLNGPMYTISLGITKNYFGIDIITENT